jgi:hypothetical protein
MARRSELRNGSGSGSFSKGAAATLRCTSAPKARPFVAVTPRTLLLVHAFRTLGTTRTLLPSSALSSPKSLLQLCQSRRVRS